LKGKIALEEHFNLPEFDHELPVYVNTDSKLRKDVQERLLDAGARRLEEMDDAGIEYSLLSLTAPGIQKQIDRGKAVVQAEQANDDLAELVAANPTRFGGLAALPMQDPVAATAELTRCATQLGFPGVMVNGFTNIGDVDTGWYYDHERFWPVWERAEGLGIPIYLHPRDSLPANTGLYEGHPELLGATWAFTVETATHALRVMTSGLFDRFPKLTFILGHLGETLPLSIWRIEHRASNLRDLRRFDKPLSHYLRENFYVTTSGNLHTPSLQATVSELSADHVLFSTDYPYESMREAATWFDRVPISESDRIKIGRTNARQLFRLDE